jgi:glutamate formiminotransferase / formiminotetrahydrofolate cyclodeaminase
MTQLIECVPNFSEGRDRTKIDAILDEISSVKGVTLLDADPGEATNRTVVTFVGAPEPVKEAAFRAIKMARNLIDMSVHTGEHPRMGATDVCPFVPVAGITMEECARHARELGARVGNELGVPVYFYEEAASADYRRNLADIRKGEYEALEEKISGERWGPDHGPSKFTPEVARSGATVIGARKFLLAYNVNLNTTDKKVAQEIAMTIREAGRIKRNPKGKFVRDENGTPIKQPGTLKSVKAVGWFIEEYNRAQISINLTDHHQTPLHEVYEECRRQAESIGAIVTGSEIIGLIPRDAMIDAGRFYLNRMGKSTGIPEEEILRTAIMSMGLDEVSEFDPRKKVIEYVIDTEDLPLISMTVKDFINEVSIETPAPGGGSVAALSGSLGAALCSMVCNLTCTKQRMDPVIKAELISIAEAAQELQKRLLHAVDRDTSAFNGVIAAKRMPKGTSEEIAARDAAIQAGYRDAAEVPLTTAEDCMKLFPLSMTSAEKGNPASITDSAVSAIMAYGGLLGAILNVRINLGSISDPQYRQEMIEKLDTLEREGKVELERVLETSNRIILSQIEK